ncbi:DNA recombination-mediator protein A [Trichormus sp. NMC-1]|uniref:DNA recombination-mediator protein A n=1 Tax=Trichormus sp. NMC-1 TaxID=1853259 RepID=UPI000A91D4B9
MSQSTDLINLDTLAQELATIQQTGSKRIALLGSRHVPITHQNLIEMMTYALVLSGNRIITSGATGSNSAAIRGATRADPNLLTVILPQSLERQPHESRQQLEQVMHGGKPAYSAGSPQAMRGIRSFSCVLVYAVHDGYLYLLIVCMNTLFYGNTKDEKEYISSDQLS